MKSLLITIAVLTAVSGAVPAGAQPVSRSAAVSVAGLDLATARGQRTLELRLLHAASDLCGTPSPADPEGRLKYAECRDQARSSAAEQVRVLAARAGVTQIAAR